MLETEKLKRIMAGHHSHRELLETVIQNIPIAVNLIRGRDLRIELINPAYQAIGPGKDMVGKTLDELWPDTQHNFEDLCRRVLATGEAYHVTDELNMIQRFQGGPLEPAYFNWALHRVNLPHGKGHGILTTVWETTKRKRAEDDLRKSEEKYRSLVESTDDSIYLVDEDCNYLFMNLNHRKRLGLSSRKVGGTTNGDYHSKQETDVFIEKVKMIFKTGRSLSYEYQSERDGNYFVRTLSPVRDDEKVQAVSVVSKDITNQKQAELEAQINRLELAHLERLATMGELTASLAHELSQPLTAILSNAQSALRLTQCNPPEIDEIHAILQDIIADDRRASQFIKHLRTFFQKDEHDKKSLNINSIIEDVIYLFKSEAITRDISIEKALDGRLPSALGNDIQLHQVILNLILNASESLMEVNNRPRRVVISAMRENTSYLKIAIRDSGKGIDLEEQESLFKPYFTTKKEGMGMGLAICRSIVEAHRGKIWAENNPDQGATFYFTLPITDEG
ncbi:MAG: PAS domain-containing protein, partial [Desulfobacteraceae bacterium]|nr:PAS domain-containing protein [Desulfobacteraceae bacterium]